MNNPTTIDDLFDLFAAKQISFEEIMHESGQSNADDVNEQLQIHLLATKAIRKHAIYQQVTDIHKMFAPEKTIETPARVITPVKSLPGASPVKWMMRIAASVTLLIGLYATQYVVFFSPDKMYETNFHEYYVNTERSVATNAENEFAAAFRKEDYGSVILLYSNLESVGNREKFLAGYSYLQLSNFSAAETILGEILQANQEQGVSYFQDEAEYYLAMAQLKQGKTESARILMQKIHDNKEHTYNESVSSWMLLRMKWY